MQIKLYQSFKEEQNKLSCLCSLGCKHILWESSSPGINVVFRLQVLGNVRWWDGKRFWFSCHLSIFNIQFSWRKYIIRKCVSHVFPREEQCMTILWFCSFLFGFCLCLLVLVFYLGFGFFVWFWGVCFVSFFCGFGFFLLLSTSIPIVICKDRGWLMLRIPTVNLMEKVWVLQASLWGIFPILLVICTYVISY